jgi:hypothetical protein
MLASEFQRARSQAIAITVMPQIAVSIRLRRSVWRTLEYNTPTGVLSVYSTAKVRGNKFPAPVQYYVDIKASLVLIIPRVSPHP